MAFTKLVSFTTLFSILTSCQPTSVATAAKTTCPPPAVVAAAHSSIILNGSTNWIVYNQIKDASEIANQRTVAQIKIPTLMASCNGFLINQDTLITNNHCIGSAANAVKVTAIFRDTDGTRTTFSCDQFITTSVLYDFTLVKCANSPGLKFGWVGLDTQKPIQLTPIYLVEENCDYISDPYCVVDKYVAFGEVLQSQTGRTFHNADTLAGSSGSPIFSETTHQVIALHNTGVPTTSTTPAMNAGVPMYQIRNVIASTTTVQVFEFGTAGNTENLVANNPVTPQGPTSIATPATCTL